MLLGLLAVVYGLRLEGPITPPAAARLRDAVEHARREGAEALVISLNTPGGLLDATRDAVAATLASDVPVVVWVGPPGARAASAGVFLVAAADLAACAPGTNLGAAHPITVGEGADSVVLRKAEEDAASWLRSLLARRGRPQELADSMVRSSRSYSAEEALELGLVDLMAPDETALLDSLRDRGVVSGEEVQWLEPGFFDRLLEVLANPNLAYILLMLGIYGLLFEIMHPGAIFPGVMGAISLILALYSFRALPVNWAALLLVLLGVGMLVAEVKVASHGVLGTGGAISLFLGSAMLFKGANYRVSWGVLIPITLMTVLLVLFIASKGLQAQLQRPRTGPEALVGQTGVAQEDIPRGRRGRVRLAGELWTAQALEDIRRGEWVRVVELRGLLLLVEPLVLEGAPPGTSEAPPPRSPG